MNYTIDLRGAGSVEDLHERIRQGMDFPEYYGANLDALFDILQECSGDVEVYGCDEPAVHLKSYMVILRNTLEEAEEENPLVSFEFK